MPTPTIPKGNDYFDATLYTGNGTGQSITNSGAMQPDFIWFKNRSGANSHALADSVRGANKILSSNNTDADYTTSAGNDLLSFNSNGFTVGAFGAFASINASGASEVAWQWKAGGAAVTNTAGTITSQVSANTTSGFSVVTWTGPNNNTTSTVGHGLGVAPAMVIYKSRNSATNWNVWHNSFTAGEVIYLNLNLGKNSDTNVFNNTAPSSTLLTVKNVEVNSSSMVAYCWSEVAGYSKFGSYVGNGSDNGPFIYTGFRPRYFLLKNTSISNTRWIVMDTARDPSNVAYKVLSPNSSGAEDDSTVYWLLDFVSNGVKLRYGADSEFNNSGNTFIYMAFAENPFKYANAR